MWELEATIEIGRVRLTAAGNTWCKLTAIRHLGCTNDVLAALEPPLLNDTKLQKRGSNKLGKPDAADATHVTNVHAAIAFVVLQETVTPGIQRKSRAVKLLQAKVAQ